MQQDRKAFVGLDTSKLKISVALAEDGRQGEVRFRGDIDNTPEAVRRLVHKLASRHGELLFGGLVSEKILLANGPELLRQGLAFWV